MGRPKFSHADFLAAARTIAAEHGLPAVTVASITERLKAPTGSFYHRFSSRNVLLAELWFHTVRDFQQGISAKLEAGDGLGAALHTPAWAREHPDEARLLLLYHRDDFIQGEWPEKFRDEASAMVEESKRGTAHFAHLVFGQDGPEALRCAQFLLAEVPVAAVRQHLLRREPPPPIVDRLIGTTFRAVAADYRGRQHRSGATDAGSSEEAAFLNP